MKRVDMVKVGFEEGYYYKVVDPTATIRSRHTRWYEYLVVRTFGDRATILARCTEKGPIQPWAESKIHQSTSRCLSYGEFIWTRRPFRPKERLHVVKQLLTERASS